VVVMKSSIFWDITPRTLNASRCFEGTCQLFHVGVLISLLFSHENGTEYSSETSVDFNLATRCYVPEDKILNTLFLFIYLFLFVFTFY
jgi:hypothetical protein